MSQAAKQTLYYAESWQKGTRQIQERRLSIRLSRELPLYEETINDASGRPRYKLKIEPRFESEQDSIPKDWSVRLIGPDDTYSLLQPDHDEGKHVFNKEDYLDFLYPVEEPDWRKTGFHGVPLSAKRVIKVEGFYCIIQVKAYHLSQSKARAFEWLEVDIDLTNKWKQDIPSLTGKDRETVEGDIARAADLLRNKECDAALQDKGIASLAAEVQKLQLGYADSQGNPIGNVFDGRLALNKVIDRYTIIARRAMNSDTSKEVDTTVQDYLDRHKADKATISSWDDGNPKDKIVFLGASYFGDSDQDRAITLVRQAAYRAGLSDSDFDKVLLDGMHDFHKLLKEKCK